MAVIAAPIEIQIGSGVHRHLIIEPEDGGGLHTVIILPDWYGRSASQEAFGHMLAHQGHSAVCLDVYGGGRIAADAGEANSLMSPLVEDRAGLTDRLVELVETVRPKLRGSSLSVMGFCFGGLCALDLARTGLAFDLCASFHGLLDPHPTLTGKPIRSKVAVFHGWRDPFAAPSSLMHLAHELDRAGASWEFHCYGQAMHAFMMEHADMPESGISYEPTAADSSWKILLSLLASEG